MPIDRSEKQNGTSKYHVVVFRWIRIRILNIEYRQSCLFGYPFGILLSTSVLSCAKIAPFISWYC